MRTTGAFEIGDLTVEPGKRSYTRLPVTSLLVGAQLGIPVHVVHGVHDGPVLGLISGIHGPEPFVMRIVREVILGLDAAELHGTIMAVPVANPIAFARSKRSTPEEDIDFGDMNRIFPGWRARPVFGGGESQPSDRSLTERMASVIAEQYLTRLDYLIDFHCHFAGCSLFESIVKIGSDGRRNEESYQLNRLFDLGQLHESSDSPPITATGYANTLGVTTAVMELGGEGLSNAMQNKLLAHGVRGIRNALRYLKMIPGEVVQPSRQLYGTWQPHVRPTKAGYLLTEYDPDSLFHDVPFGVAIREGDLLGKVFDPYTLEEIERLYAPTDGILYMCRRSGPIESGGHAFAVTALEGAHWID